MPIPYLKLAIMTFINSVVFFDHKSLFNSSYENVNQWITIIVLHGIYGALKEDKQIKDFVSMHIRIVTKNNNLSFNTGSIGEYRMQCIDQRKRYIKMISSSSSS